jgi:hypothetical protein
MLKRRPVREQVGRCLSLCCLLSVHELRWFLTEAYGVQVQCFVSPTGLGRGLCCQASPPSRRGILEAEQRNPAPPPPRALLAAQESNPGGQRKCPNEAIFVYMLFFLRASAREPSLAPKDTTFLLFSSHSFNRYLWSYRISGRGPDAKQVERDIQKSK